jgi:hypothetical protein
VAIGQEGAVLRLARRELGRANVFRREVWSLDVALELPAHSTHTNVWLGDPGAEPPLTPLAVDATSAYRTAASTNVEAAIIHTARTATHREQVEKRRLGTIVLAARSAVATSIFPTDDKGENDAEDEAAPASQLGP